MSAKKIIPQILEYVKPAGYSSLTMEQMYNDEDGELNIKGFIDFYGPTDLLSIRRQSETQDHTSAKSPVGMLLGGYPLDDRLELAKTASPVHYIEQAKEVSPALIMHGDKDEIVPFEQSLQFYEKMRAYGKDVRFYAGKFIYRHICDILVKNIG